MSAIVIYTVGSVRHGLGHVKRCLTLARALRKRGVGVIFATEHETPGVEILRGADFTTYEYHPLDYSWARLGAQYAGGLIDLENGPPLEMLSAAREGFARLVIVNGSGYTLREAAAVRAASDLRVYQSITPTDDAQGVSGVEYMCIDPAYAELEPDFDGPIVVSMGGSDPHNLTPRVVEALAGIGRSIKVILGAATLTPDPLPTVEGVEYISAPDSLSQHLNGAALLIGALGMTAYEAAAAGVPAVLSAWSEDHLKTAHMLERENVANSIGRWDQFDGDQLRAVVEDMLGDREQWQGMSEAGKRLVDGRGVERVAERIVEMIA